MRFVFHGSQAKLVHEVYEVYEVYERIAAPSFGGGTGHL